MRTYDGPEHESLRAVARCLVVNYGEEGVLQLGDALRTFNAFEINELSPFGANYCRKVLERRLPIRGDYAS